MCEISRGDSLLKAKLQGASKRDFTINEQICFQCNRNRNVTLNKSTHLCKTKFGVGLHVKTMSRIIYSKICNIRRISTSILSLLFEKN